MTKRNRKELKGAQLVNVVRLMEAYDMDKPMSITCNRGERNVRNTMVGIAVVKSKSERVMLSAKGVITCIRFAGNSICLLLGKLGIRWRMVCGVETIKVLMAMGQERKMAA